MITEKIKASRGIEGDFFEWIGLYENILLFKKRVEILESAIRE